MEKLEPDMGHMLLMIYAQAIFSGEGTLISKYASQLLFRFKRLSLTRDFSIVY
jgi:hypothetical protein